MSVRHPNGHDPLGDAPEPEHDPDPKWALEDMGGDDDDIDRRPGVPFWVILLAVLIALALLLQLGWPLVMDLLERNQDTPGFPTPGPV